MSFDLDDFLAQNSQELELLKQSVSVAPPQPMALNPVTFIGPGDEESWNDGYYQFVKPVAARSMLRLDLGECQLPLGVRLVRPTEKCLAAGHADGLYVGAISPQASEKTRQLHQLDRICMVPFSSMCFVCGRESFAPAPSSSLSFCARAGQ